MIHYTCDRCRRRIDTQTELHYTINVVMKAVLDGPEIEVVTDHEQQDEIDDMLRRVDDDTCEELCEELYQSRHFDLCCDCYKQYKKDPLSAETTVGVGFSQN